MKRQAILRKVRNIAIGTVATFLVLVGGAVAYTWYMGTQSNTVVSTAAPLEAEEKPAPFTPRQSAPDAPVNVSTQMITSPVKAGENASITVKTNTNIDCTITVTYGKIGEEANQSRDSGLKPRTSDRFGMVTWTWTVEPGRPDGSWPVEVTCANEAKSGYVQAKLVVGNVAETN